MIMIPSQSGDTICRATRRCARLLVCEKHYNIINKVKNTKIDGCGGGGGVGGYDPIQLFSRRIAMDNNAAQQSSDDLNTKDDYRPRRFPSRPVFVRIGLMRPRRRSSYYYILTYCYLHYKMYYSLARRGE